MCPAAWSDPDRHFGRHSASQPRLPVLPDAAAPVFQPGSGGHGVCRSCTYSCPCTWCWPRQGRVVQLQRLLLGPLLWHHLDVKPRVQVLPRPFLAGNMQLSGLGASGSLYSHHHCSRTMQKGAVELLNTSYPPMHGVCRTASTACGQFFLVVPPLVCAWGMGSVLLGHKVYLGFM